MVGLGVDFADAPGYVTPQRPGTAVLLSALAARAVHRPAGARLSMVVYGEGRYRCAEHGERRARARGADDLAAGRFEPRCPACGGPLSPASVTEAAPLDPRNVYAATKLHQEHLCARFAARDPARP